jgi:hypothetical protein
MDMNRYLLFGFGFFGESKLFKDVAVALEDVGSIKTKLGHQDLIHSQ